MGIKPYFINNKYPNDKFNGFISICMDALIDFILKLFWSRNVFDKNPILVALIYSNE